MRYYNLKARIFDLQQEREELRSELDRTRALVEALNVFHTSASSPSVSVSSQPDSAVLCQD